MSVSPYEEVVDDGGIVSGQSEGAREAAGLLAWDKTKRTAVLVTDADTLLGRALAPMTWTRTKPWCRITHAEVTVSRTVCPRSTLHGLHWGVHWYAVSKQTNDTRHYSLTHPVTQQMCTVTLRANSQMIPGLTLRRCGGDVTHRGQGASDGDGVVGGGGDGALRAVRDS